jgi:DNA-binding NarL/FixJ family response regulator
VVRHQTTQSRAAFTMREQQILRFIAAGRSDRQIAFQLKISPHTLRTHVDRVFRRHGLHSRAAAVAKWICNRYDLKIPDVDDMDTKAVS